MGALQSTASVPSVSKPDSEPWQFANDKDEVVFESSDVKEIKAKLLNGTLSPYARFRKKSSKTFRPITESFTKDECSFGLLYYPIIRAHIRQGVTLGKWGLGCLVMIGIFLFEIDLLRRGSSGIKWIVASAPTIGAALIGGVLAGSAIGGFIGLCVGLVRLHVLRGRAS